MTIKLTEDTIFRNLNFTQEWIELGIVNVNIFSKIKEEYLKGEYPRAEHYRWWAFTDFIQKNKTISNSTFYKIYNLSKKDTDYAMGRAMRFDLIQHLNCPQEVIEIAIKDEDKALSRKASKIKEARINFGIRS